MAYATRAQLELIFAATDIVKWADLTGQRDQTEIDANVTEALDQATSDIDDILRGGRYDVPFSPVPRYIMDVCRTLAGCYLYKPRGSQDVDDEGNPRNRLSGREKEAKKKLRMIRAGQIDLDAEEVASKVPFVVNTTVHRKEETTCTDDPFAVSGGCP